VLFEMLTGERLFASETVPETLAGVIRAEIDLDRLPAGTPPALRRLLERCLERDPKRRLRDVGEARVLLEGAVGLADEHDLHSAWFRAAGNLCVAFQDSDRYAELLELTDALEARARQLGDREQLAQARLGVCGVLSICGLWDDAIAREDEADQLAASPWARSAQVSLSR